MNTSTKKPSKHHNTSQKNTFTNQQIKQQHLQHSHKKKNNTNNNIISNQNTLHKNVLLSYYLKQLTQHPINKYQIYQQLNKQINNINPNFISNYHHYFKFINKSNTNQKFIKFLSFSSSKNIHQHHIHQLSQHKLLTNHHLSNNHLLSQSSINPKFNNDNLSFSSFDYSHYNNGKYLQKNNQTNKIASITIQNKLLIHQQKQDLIQPNQLISLFQQNHPKHPKIHSQQKPKQIPQRPKTQLKKYKKPNKYKPHFIPNHKKQQQIYQQFRQLSIPNLTSKLLSIYQQFINYPPPIINKPSIQIPPIPPPPHSNQSPQQHLQLITKLYKSLNIQPHHLPPPIKKYLNCITFPFKNPQQIIIWNYNGTLYLGHYKFKNQSNIIKQGLGQYITKCYYYHGQFKNNKKMGKGLLVWDNGSYYDGLWKNNKMDGQGIFYNISNHTLYSGHWLNGKQNGEGTIIYSKTHYYIGNFHQRQKSGKGRQYFQNGDIYYGNYSHNNQTGNGTYFSHKNTIYLGNFQTNTKHGKGLLINYHHLSKQLIQKYYYGQFINNQKSGYGIQKYHNGTCYYGYYYNNIFQGIGILKNYLKTNNTNQSTTHHNHQLSKYNIIRKIPSRNNSIQSTRSTKQINSFFF